MIKKIKKHPSTQKYRLTVNIYVCPLTKREESLIRGPSYYERLVILKLMPYRASYPIFDWVYGAAAVKKAEVNQSTTVRK